MWLTVVPAVQAWVTHCDVVFWVSNIETAFLTTHEKREFENIAQQLSASSHQTGDLYSIAIVLSKYNHLDSGDGHKGASKKRRDLQHNGEIMEDEEDTTLVDCFQRVKNLFPSGVPILKFNAFGRILHGKNIRLI